MMMQRRADVAPPVIPPAPVATRPAICDDRTPVLVFFEFDSAVPPESARSALEAITQNANTCRWQGIAVAGHTDLAGSDDYNIGLSRQRADAIANVLTSSGIAASSLEISAVGEAMPRVPTADGVRNPQNRRVEITTK